jgi:2-polyprenyl-6-methoxyphenol hydroxylase-like FAD-dependent oxidoreductase
MTAAVVGCGTGGPAAARYLARLGHDVTVFERVRDPQPVGAGILLQPTGQQVLRDLGLLDAVTARSSVIDRVYAVSHTGRTVMDFGYRDLASNLRGYGVHRGVLFDALYDGLAGDSIELRLGVEITGVGDRHIVDAEGRRHGPFELVVLADGARSRLRDPGLVRRDRQYPWGAIWAIVEDRRGRWADTLYQHYRGTRVTLGLLPTGAPVGTPLVSLYWSIENRRAAAGVPIGVGGFKAEVGRLTGEADEVLDEIVDAGQLVHAVYRDVVMRRFHTGRVALVGDSAHAMSPQLGQGANLALLDAAALGRALEMHDHLPAALEAYSAARRGHVRFYTWVSRLMTPLFQSNLTPLGPPRDLVLDPVSRPRPVRRFMVGLLAGVTALRQPPTDGRG